jgi:hypothetical protein
VTGKRNPGPLEAAIARARTRPRPMELGDLYTQDQLWALMTRNVVASPAALEVFRREVFNE